MMTPKKMGVNMSLSPVNLQTGHGHSFSGTRVDWRIDVHHTRYEMFQAATILASSKLRQILCMVYQQFHVFLTEAIRGNLPIVYLHALFAAVALKKNSRELWQSDLHDVTN